MSYTELALEIGKKYFIPLRFLQIISLILFLFSPIIWIWLTFTLAFKICLTGFLVNLISRYMYNQIKNTIESSIIETYKKSINDSNYQSKFLNKLEKIKNKI
jgi:hypothetical protein